MTRATPEIQLERLRSPEVEERIRDGWTNVVFACGAVEQHGPHLPLLVDAEHGTALVTALANKLGKTIVAPTVRIGCSDHHMAYSGTITLRKSTFAAVVTDYVTSLAKHGFERIVIVPTHGGNFGPLDELRATLEESARPASVFVYTQLMELLEIWRNVVQDQVKLGDRVGGHADVAETSIIMHLHPELVRQDLAEPGFQGDLDETAIRRMIDEGFDAVTPNGILGDARGASPVVGAQLIDVLATHLAATVEGRHTDA